MRYPWGGFRGGHSGVEIDKDRLNAIKELASWLKDKGARLAGFEAPGKFNAISRQAKAYVTRASAEEMLKHQRPQAEQWRQTEADTQLVIREAAPLEPYTQEASQRILGLIAGMPNGVNTWSADLPGLVESSSNLGVAEEGQDTLTLTTSIRSSQSQKMADIVAAMQKLAKEYDAKVSVSGAYPGWAYEKESLLRDKAVKVWEALFGKAPEVTAVHGGLECGVLKAKYPDVQMLSFGPDLHEVHTPREHADLASVERVYGFLKALLKALKK